MSDQPTIARQQAEERIGQLARAMMDRAVAVAHARWEHEQVQRVAATVPAEVMFAASTARRTAEYELDAAVEAFVAENVRVLREVR